MHGAIPPPPIWLHGMVLSLSTGISLPLPYLCLGQVVSSLKVFQSKYMNLSPMHATCPVHLILSVHTYSNLKHYI
jgi:hypothetical protein